MFRRNGTSICFWTSMISEEHIPHVNPIFVNKNCSIIPTTNLRDPQLDSATKRTHRRVFSATQAASWLNRLTHYLWDHIVLQTSSLTSLYFTDQQIYQDLRAIFTLHDHMTSCHSQQTNAFQPLACPSINGEEEQTSCIFKTYKNRCTMVLLVDSTSIEQYDSPQLDPVYASFESKCITALDLTRSTIYCLQGTAMASTQPPNQTAEPKFEKMRPFEEWSLLQNGQGWTNNRPQARCGPL